MYRRTPAATLIGWSALLLMVGAGLAADGPGDIPPNPAPNPAPESPDGFFGLTRLWTLHLRFTSEGWDRLAPAEPAPSGPGRPPAGEREFPWSRCVVEFAGVRLDEVAVRFKGNSSYNLSRRTGKHPFKLDFNRGHPDRTFVGMQALWLNNNANDPDQMGEALAYDAFRRAGVAAPRTAFVRLRVTVEGRREDSLLGLYTAVEAVDGPFLRRAFGTADGLLAKPERLAGIEYLGTDWAAYHDRYHVRDGSSPAAREALVDLARWIDQAPSAEFRGGLEMRADVPGLLRFLAVNALLANHDSFLGTGHNYHLFLPGTDSRARFIPWDLNEAYGRHPPAGPPSEQVRLSVLRPGGGRNRLLERVLADPELSAAYRGELERLGGLVLDADRIGPETGRIAAMTGPVIEAERAGVPRLPGAGPRLGGPGGPVPSPLRSMPLVDWIRQRAAFVADELAGRVRGVTPEGRRPGPGRGGPGRPPAGRPQGPRPPDAPGLDVRPPRTEGSFPP